MVGGIDHQRVSPQVQVSQGIKYLPNAVINSAYGRSIAPHDSLVLDAIAILDKPRMGFLTVEATEFLIGIICRVAIAVSHSQVLVQAIRGIVSDVEKERIALFLLYKINRMLCNRVNIVSLFTIDLVLPNCFIVIKG